MNWEFDEYGCWNIKGEDFYIFLQPRPSYCDRGRWLAHLNAYGELARKIDIADGWPRYYFGLEVAKTEIEAWLLCRKQTPLDLEQDVGAAHAESAQQSLKFCTLSLRRAKALLRLSALSFKEATQKKSASNWGRILDLFCEAMTHDVERLVSIIDSPLTQQMIETCLGPQSENLEAIAAIKLLRDALGAEHLEVQHEDN